MYEKNKSITIFQQFYWALAISFRLPSLYLLWCLGLQEVGSVFVSLTGQVSASKQSLVFVDIGEVWHGAKGGFLLAASPDVRGIPCFLRLEMDFDCFDSRGEKKRTRRSYKNCTF
jgi:hypothetical protein